MKVFSEKFGLCRTIFIMASGAQLCDEVFVTVRLLCPQVFGYGIVGNMAYAAGTGDGRRHPLSILFSGSCHSKVVVGRYDLLFIGMAPQAQGRRIIV